MHDALSQQGSTYFPCVYESPVQIPSIFTSIPLGHPSTSLLQLVSVVPEPSIPQTQGMPTKKHPAKMVVKSLTLKPSIDPALSNSNRPIRPR